MSRAEMENFHNGKSDIKEKENSLKDNDAKRKVRGWLCNNLLVVETKP